MLVSRMVPLFHDDVKRREQSGTIKPVAEKNVIDHVSQVLKNNVIDHASKYCG